jgi:hypothetical protein
MKKLVGLLVVLTCIQSILFAQARTTIGVTSVEANGVSLIPSQAAALVRIELGKINKYAVIDKYDVSAVLKKAQVNPDSCLGKTCAVEAGKLLGAVKMITGSIEHFGQKIIVTFHLIDVQAGLIEKTQVDEYLYLPEFIQEIVGTSIARLLDSPVNEETVRKLTQPNDYESEINNPGTDRLRLNGPRIGVTFLTGNMAARFMAHESQGGFNDQPFMFIFGYQQEVQYLNSGKYQALFEFVPAVIGLDKELLIPSLSFMNGLRNNVSGWEFAIGPNFTVVQTAKGFYTADGKWHLESEFASYNVSPEQIEEQLDSRGTIRVKSAFIFAVGKSLKSGKMNIPLNAYFVPSKDGARIGLSFGFNGRKDMSK